MQKCSKVQIFNALIDSRFSSLVSCWLCACPSSGFSITCFDHPAKIGAKTVFQVQSWLCCQQHIVWMAQVMSWRHTDPFPHSCPPVRPESVIFGPGILVFFCKRMFFFPLYRWCWLSKRFCLCWYSTKDVAPYGLVTTAVAAILSLGLRLVQLETKMGKEIVSHKPSVSLCRSVFSAIVCNNSSSLRYLCSLVTVSW